MLVVVSVDVGFGLIFSCVVFYGLLVLDGFGLGFRFDV